MFAVWKWSQKWSFFLYYDTDTFQAFQAVYTDIVCSKWHKMIKRILNILCEYKISLCICTIFVITLWNPISFRCMLTMKNITKCSVPTKWKKKVVTIESHSAQPHWTQTTFSWRSKVILFSVGSCSALPIYGGWYIY